MGNLNRVLLIGHVLDDPEARTTFSGSAMLKFRLRVDRPQELAAREASDIFDVVAWERLAEQVKLIIHRDALVLVEGRLQIRSFDGKDGRRKYVTEVVARSVDALSRGGKEPTASPSAPPVADEIDFADFEAEESLSKGLPF